ncbi:MAG TPA: ABC transporter permease, partial [Bryobacteraceae bacterium]|nr:ABC transporter permease [Bryobacteraceae bacterium]
MRQRIRTIIRKEFRQVFRDPRMRGLLFIPPLMQLLIFGYAANLDVNNARIAWMDEDHSPHSRELLSQFLGSGRFIIAATPSSEAEMQDAMDRGRVDGVVRVLPGFARDIERGRPTGVQVLLDGSNSNSASIVSAYAGQTIARYAAEVMEDRQRQKLVAAGVPMHPAIPQVVTETRVWFNPELKSRNYFIPGVIVNIIMLTTLSLTTMAIVREKELGTMEQLMVTPIRPAELILGKTLPFVVIGFWDMLLVLAASLVIFHVPFAGSFWLLSLASLLFILTTLGAGLFISTISRTQQQANMATFLLFQPFMML